MQQMKCSHQVFVQKEQEFNTLLENADKNCLTNNVHIYRFYYFFFYFFSSSHIDINTPINFYSLLCETKSNSNLLDISIIPYIEVGMQKETE